MLSHELTVWYQGIAEIFPSVLNAVSIMVFNTIYSKLAVVLNNWGEATVCLLQG